MGIGIRRPVPHLAILKKRIRSAYYLNTTAVCVCTEILFYVADILLYFRITASDVVAVNDGKLCLGAVRISDLVVSYQPVGIYYKDPAPEPDIFSLN